MTTVVDQAAALLHSARNERRQLTELPAEVRPTSVEDGYAVQHAGHQLTNTSRGPWKVGATSQFAMDFLGADAPFIGRPDPDRVAASGTIPIAEWCVGSAAVEIEIGLVSRVDLVDVPTDPLDFADAVDVFPCIEVVNSRFADMTAVGVASLIADNGVASGIVQGNPRQLTVDEVRSLDTLSVSLVVDGAEHTTSNGAAALGHPLNVLHFAAMTALGWGTPIRAGELVITGTCTGLFIVHPGMQIEGRFGDTATVTAIFN